MKYQKGDIVRVRRGMCKPEYAEIVCVHEENDENARKYYNVELFEKGVTCYCEEIDIEKKMEARELAEVIADLQSELWQAKIKNNFLLNKNEGLKGLDAGSSNENGRMKKCLAIIKSALEMAEVKDE